MRTHTHLTSLVGLALVGATLVAATHSADAADDATSAFQRTATYPVFQNLPAGVDPKSTTVAEISAVSQDGNTLFYTDALGKRIGILDITDSANPVGKGAISLATTGHADDQPTSVAVVGDYLVVVVDSSGGDFVNPSGYLNVYRISDRSLVRTMDLGGQPDSIAISADKQYAAIAMENQRDEEVNDGDIPQNPAGFVQVLGLAGAPDAWTRTKVELPEAQLAAAGLAAPSDPEPEYVTINAANKLALTLQENNGIVVIDLADKSVERVFTAGNAQVDGIDVTKDATFNATGSLDLPREPDAIGWIDERYVATANEGDWKGGTRGWTIFDTTTGTVAWDAGNSFERLALQHGLFNNDRAAKKGSEPEGLMIATIGGKRRAFVGSERSNFVAVYDLTDPTKPVFEQILPTTNGPEGLLAVPARNLIAISSETDDASVSVRASVSLYRFGAGDATFPSILSETDTEGAPIGWGALGALSAAPGRPGHLWTASDSAFKPGRLYRVNVEASPAVIERALNVKTAAGGNANLDIEGLFARPQGGFWLASEGANGAGNQLIRTNSAGTIQQTVTLPADVAAKVGKWGFEGVTATNAGGKELVYVALQRPLFTDTTAATGEVDGTGVARIGRYDVATNTWSWFGYQLESTSTPGDWMGLSEITAVDDDTLAVIERDKLNGPAARIKRVYTVDVPATGGTTTPVRLTKKLAVDVLPALRATKGWTQEKLEGLTIGADGNVYAVTDNDGLKDATGETVFLKLGTATSIFGPALTTSPTPTTSPTTTTTTAPLTRTKSGLRVALLKRKGAKRVVRLKARLKPGSATGKVVFKVNGKRVGVRTLRDGAARMRVTVRKGVRVFRVVYRGDTTHAASTASVRRTLR
jgi:hypothetical protein